MFFHLKFFTIVLKTSGPLAVISLTYSIYRYDTQGGAQVGLRSFIWKNTVVIILQ